jgi:CPA2 family monovalent cation:H+ antiporter-2
LRTITGGDLRLNALLWLGSMLVSLPFFIVIFGKLRALGMVIAETGFSSAAVSERTATVRAAIAQAIPLVGMAALGFWVIVLSAAVLPPLKVLWVLVLIVACVALLFWRSMVRLYSRAQFALTEVLSETTEPRPEPEPAGPLSTILKNAQVRTIEIAASSAAAGKLIGELQLRTRTGASVVGIERNGASIINPGPEEEIRSGDRVVLLGSEAQLSVASNALLAPVKAPIA